MAFNIASITTESRFRAPRIILLGVEKIGKSTFAAGSDAPIFIPIKGEEGIDSIPVPQFPTCHKLSDVMSCLYSLYSDVHEYRTAIIDSASALEPLVWSDVCQQNGNAPSIEKVNGGYGKGYIEAIYTWRKITEALDALRNERNIASILIGHTKIKRVDSPDGASYDQWQFDLNDKAANLLYRWADVILFAKTKVVVKTEEVGFNKERGRGIDISGGQRFLYTQKNPAYPSGGRGIYGQLPAELPLSWGSFIDAVSVAKPRVG
jgi:hypothetical protein